ncbi:MAG: hydroxyacid dehydrogenase [Thermoproteota archaeon]|nr:hydroxyacid dehydrogenase [Candidatus Brockarchaeota archaeon]MBO3801108.1 hydroxyacid dehydrogenase [Candidatus Brockarchaeota archaeon]
MSSNQVKVLITIPSNLYKLVSRDEDEEELRSFAECIFNPFNRNLSEEELSKLIADVDGCITSWGSPKFTEVVLKNANKLKIIGHAAGSVKPYITDEVFKKGIVVVNAASTIAKSVAEFTLAMILNCLRGIPKYIEAMDKKNWDYKEQKGFTTYDLRGKIIGIIGFGVVAKELVNLLKPFDVNIIVYDPYSEPKEIALHGAKKVELSELLLTSDIISLHAASTPETYHMLGEKEFRLMKSTAYVINTSRGANIDEKALAKALREKWIAGAALDVFEQEPLQSDSPLYKLDNVFLTPHIAGPSDERRSQLFGTIVKDFKRFFSGERPINEVSYEKLKFLA